MNRFDMGIYWLILSELNSRFKETPKKWPYIKKFVNVVEKSFKPMIKTVSDVSTVYMKTDR